VLYVPVIPHREDPPSPRTRELADLLGRVIQDYEKDHPSVTGREVRAALEIAVRGARSGVMGSREVALGVAVAAAVAGVFVWLAGQGGSPAASPIAVAVVMALVAAVAVALLARRARGG
jgi:hypothetical protein